MQNRKKRPSLFTDGEEFTEDQSQSKRQRIGKSSIRFYHKAIAALPDAVQCFISNLVNPCSNQVEIIGKLFNNGQMIFASNRELVLWNCSALYEFTNVFDESDVLIVPFPPGVTSVNPDLVIVTGLHNQDVFICTVSGTLYYSHNGSAEYTSVVLPIHNFKAKAIYPYDNEKEVLVVTEDHSLYKVSVQETEVEEITSTIPLQITLKTSYNLVPTYLSRGYDSVLRSLWTSFFGSSTPHICHFFQFPHLVLIENQSLRIFNVQSNKIEFHQNLHRILPEPCEILRVWFDSDSSFVFFTRSLSERSSYHIDLLTKTSSSLVLSRSVLLPFTSWLDSPTLQLSVNPTVNGLEVYLLYPSTQPALLVASLFSVPSVTTYLPHLASPLLFAAPCPPMAGLLFVTSSHFARFVAETTSSPKIFASEQLFFSVPLSLQRLELSDTVSAQKIVECCTLWSQECFYTCAALFSMFLNRDVDLKPVLLQVFSLLSNQTDPALLIAFFELCGHTHYLRYLRDSLPLLTQTISHLTLCAFLRVPTATNDEEALHDFQRRVETHEEIVTTLTSLSSTLASLSSSQQRINQCLPHNFELSIASWIYHPTFTAAVASLVRFVRSSLHDPHDSLGILNLPTLFTSCCKELIATYNQKNIELAELCFEGIADLQPQTAQLLAQKYRSYHYLSLLPLKVLLPMAKRDEELAEYCLTSFAKNLSAKVVKMGIQHRQMALELFKDKPELLWRFLILEKASCEKTLEVIKQIQDKSLRAEALGHLWLLAKSRKESGSVLNEIDECRLMTISIS